MASFAKPGERYEQRDEAQFRRAVEQELTKLTARDAGWVAMTGTGDKDTAYATSTITLEQLAERVKALEDALLALLILDR